MCKFYKSTAKLSKIHIGIIIQPFLPTCDIKEFTAYLIIQYLKSYVTLKIKKINTNMLRVNFSKFVY